MTPSHCLFFRCWLLRAAAGRLPCASLQLAAHTRPTKIAAFTWFAPRRRLAAARGDMFVTTGVRAMLLGSFERRVRSRSTRRSCRCQWCMADTLPLPVSRRCGGACSHRRRLLAHEASISPRLVGSDEWLATVVRAAMFDSCHSVWTAQQRTRALQPRISVTRGPSAVDAMLQRMDGSVPSFRSAASVDGLLRDHRRRSC